MSTTFYPVSSTVALRGAVSPFFQPGDIACYLSGAEPQYFVIREITLDHVVCGGHRFAVRARSGAVADLPLYAIRAADLPGAPPQTDSDASRAFSGDPRIGTRSQYLRAVKRDPLTRAALLM